MLLGMRGQLWDYNDGDLLDFQLAHPAVDIQPYTFLTNVSKKFSPKFRYSSIGYVIMGFVIASLTNESSWDQIDQKSLAFRGGKYLSPDEFPGTIFMRDGLCSTHQNVVHQYTYHPSRTTENMQCNQANWYPNLVATGDSTGDLLARFKTDSPLKCCSNASQIPAAQRTGHGAWTFLPNNTCIVYASAHPLTHIPGAVTGASIDGKLHLSDFKDLYNTSCLNGWTMGNIAITASDMSKYWAALATGRIVNLTSLAQIIDMKLIAGGLPGGLIVNGSTQYGLGTFSLLLRFAVGNHSAKCGFYSNFCKCESQTDDTIECFFETDAWGHGGLDWGSGFPMSGWVPGLNLSFSLGSNVGEGFPSGMNTSITRNMNRNAYGVALCRLINSTVQTVLPGFPVFLGFDLNFLKGSCDPQQSILI